MRRTRFRRYGRIFAGLVCLFVVGLGVHGSSAARETSFWTSETATDFRGGTPGCVSISSRGTVSLAPRLDTLMSSQESYIWSLAEDGLGNLYAGSGDEGKVYRISAKGEVTVVLDSDELEILSLAVGREGHVFAGTSPGGLIYRITPDGQSSVFFESEASYIWCLVFDDAGNLYAGSGDDGKVYRIEPDGTGEVFYETDERHVMCADYEGGRLVVGTEGSGLVLSISGPGQAEVLYDCNEDEVRDLAISPDGIVYAAAVSGGREDEGEAGQSNAKGFGSGSEEQGKLRSSIYRIEPDGATRNLWSTTRSQFHSLWIAADDSIVIGTGDEGTLYCLANGELELLHKVGESQILDILGRGDALFLCTGNRAKVYSVGPAFCSEGELVSKAFDAVGVSRWGTLDWTAETPEGTSVAFSVRVGNSEKPDRTWTDWSEQLLAAGRISEMRSARFIQWKVALRTARPAASPSLRKVTLSYTERNLPPRVGFVRVIPQGVPFSAGGIDKITDRVSQTLPGGVQVEYSLISGGEESAVEQAVWARTFRTALWDASDPNGDRQVFSIFYKALEEESWKLLEEEFSELIYTWNTASFPDGSYVLKVVASDSPDNLPSDVLTSESTSLPFEVDNTPPRVANLKLRPEEGGLRLSGDVSDNMSPLVALDYSLNGSGWNKLQASDGLLDSTDETFSLLLANLSAGENSVVVRVRDRAGNIGAGRVRAD